MALAIVCATTTACESEYGWIPSAVWGHGRTCPACAPVVHLAPFNALHTSITPSAPLIQMSQSDYTYPCSGNCSYWATPQFQATLDASPDIITIMLGTNDAKYLPRNRRCRAMISSGLTRAC
jgi:hypothetical protein